MDNYKRIDDALHSHDGYLLVTCPFTDPDKIAKWELARVVEREHIPSTMWLTKLLYGATTLTDKEEVERKKILESAVSNKFKFAIHLPTVLVNPIYNHQIAIDCNKIAKDCTWSIEELLQYHAYLASVESYSTITIQPDKLKVSFDDPEFQIAISGSHSIDEIFNIYVKLHYTANDHHTEYWTGRSMSDAATFELFCDHLCSAFRTAPTYTDAINEMLRWEVSGCSLKSKYKCASLNGYMMFLSTISKYRVSDEDITTMHNVATQARTVVIPTSGRRELEELMRRWQEGESVENLYGNIKIKYPTIQYMETEIRMHIRYVESMIRLRYPDRCHDRDKMRFPRILALALRFCTFEPSIS